ncbi:MAG TPA: ABC transporter permease [Kofleriaceae bacterium]
MLLFHYGLRSLFVRMRANLVTMLAVALFVAGGTIGLTFYLNLRGQVVESAPPEHVLVMQKGAASEGGSKLDLERVRELPLLAEVKKDGDAPAAVREFVTSVQVNTAGEYASALIRGIDDKSIAIRGVKLLEGAAPAPGTLEIMVGRRLQLTHPHLKIGSELYLTGGKSPITGVFEAAGSPFEDELWTHRSALEIHLKRKGASSSATLVAKDASSAQSLIASINSKKDSDLQAESLAALRQKAAGVSGILNVVLVLLILLSVVATSAIATTMAAAVSTRLPEFAVLVAIGIRRSVLGRMVIMESVLLAILGAALGVGVSEILRRVLGIIQIGTTPVEMGLVPLTIPIGIVLGLFVGLVGGIGPATTLRRLEIIKTLR